MRVITLLTIIAALAASATADTAGKPSYDCFARLVNDTLVGDAVTIYTNDNRVISGIYPISVTSTSLYGKPLVELGTAETVRIRFEDIDRITYSTPNKAAKILPIMGLILGSIGGAAVGSTFPENDPPRGFEMIEINKNAILGFGIGAIFGTALGAEIGKHINIRVNLQCR